MNEQCIKLKDTFDTRYIKENKDLFYKISKENVNSGKGNNTLMRLIINEKEYAEDRAKMCEFIKGPFSLSKHYNKETNTTIYLFGEIHSIEDTCNELSNNFLGIDDFLEELMAKTNVFLDIYLEVGTEDIFRNNIHKDLKLYLLYDKFKKCINSRTRDNLEECSLSRVHYGDIRNLTFMGKILDLYYGKNYLTADDILNYENGYVLDIIKSFSKCKSEAETSAFLKKDFNFNIQNKVLQKEISKCPYGDQIVNFFRSIVVNENLNELYAAIYDKLIQASIDILAQLKLVKVYKFPSYILMEKINIFLHQYMCNLYYIMDIYLLCRIFRKFKPTENKPSEQSNIIIYAGNFHSELYREFLETMNFKMEKYTDNLKPFKNCVNVKDFLPLFE